ncbi:TRAP transporter small permease subunit [Phreatobacter sp.]|uniref:TRAP transporter small permease subunit n=1 Tax=Phreatobacter sp. TaxID=1966341 RepID=UPI003F6ECD7A
MRRLLGVSNAIDAVLKSVAHVGAWFFIACIVTICFDVITRKAGFQLNLFGIDLGSTRLQELEWHFHAVLFLTWLGYAYIRNAHVRIDVFTGHLDQRRQARLELIGCIIFALPYLFVALPFAHEFFVQSFRQMEGSNAPNGLPYRFVIKGFLYYGFLSVLAAVISVMLRRIVFLWGPPPLADEALHIPAKA